MSRYYLYCCCVIIQPPKEKRESLYIRLSTLAAPITSVCVYIIPIYCFVTFQWADVKMRDTRERERERRHHANFLKSNKFTVRFWRLFFFFFITLIKPKILSIFSGYCCWLLLLVIVIILVIVIFNKFYTLQDRL